MVAPEVGLSSPSALLADARAEGRRPWPVLGLPGADQAIPDQTAGNCQKPGVPWRSSAWSVRGPAMTSQLAEQRTAQQLTAVRGRGPGGRLVALPRAGRCPIAGCGEQIDPSR